MEKNKYPRMLNVVERRWKIMEELKWSPKVMWSPKIKESTSAHGNQISGNKWGSYLLGNSNWEVNAHLGRSRRIFGGDFCEKLSPHWFPPIYTCHFIMEFDFAWGILDATWEIWICMKVLWDCHHLPWN